MIPPLDTDIYVCVYVYGYVCMGMCVYVCRNTERLTLPWGDTVTMRGRAVCVRVAVCCSVLQCIAVCSSVLQAPPSARVEVRCLQCCSVLWCVAAFCGERSDMSMCCRRHHPRAWTCGVLQCCGMLQHCSDESDMCNTRAGRCKVYSALCVESLQHTATHCNKLQQTSRPLQSLLNIVC